MIYKIPALMTFYEHERAWDEEEIEDEFDDDENGDGFDDPDDED